MLAVECSVIHLVHNEVEIELRMCTFSVEQSLCDGDHKTLYLSFTCCLEIIYLFIFGGFRGFSWFHL